MALTFQVTVCVDLLLFKQPFSQSCDERQPWFARKELKLLLIALVKYLSRQDCLESIIISRNAPCGPGAMRGSYIRRLTVICNKLFNVYVSLGGQEIRFGSEIVLDCSTNVLQP